MSRTSGIGRLVLLWTLLAFGFCYFGSTPVQRAYSLAKLLATSPTTSHWRIPISSFRNRHPASEVIAVCDQYPAFERSVPLLGLESVVFATGVLALLYGGLRERLWARRDRDVRPDGHGPRLVPIYPEALWVKHARVVLIFGAFLGAGAWLIGQPECCSMDHLRFLSNAILRAVREPDAQHALLVRLGWATGALALAYLAGWTLGVDRWLSARLGGAVASA